MSCLLNQIDEIIQKAQDRLVKLMEDLEAQPVCKQADIAVRAAEEVCTGLEELKGKQEKVCEFRDEIFSQCTLIEKSLEKDDQSWRKHPDPYGLHGIEYVEPSVHELTQAAIEGVREIQNLLNGETNDD